MYAVQLIGTNLFVTRGVGRESLTEGSGSTWSTYPDINRFWGQGPWIEDIATALEIDIEDDDAMDDLADQHGNQLFEVVEVAFTAK